MINKKIDYVQWLAFAMVMVGILLDGRQRNSIGLYLIIAGWLIMAGTIILNYKIKKM